MGAARLKDWKIIIRKNGHKKGDKKNPIPPVRIQSHLYFSANLFNASINYLFLPGGNPPGCLNQILRNPYHQTAHPHHHF